jgi:hypothetical protein
MLRAFVIFTLALFVRIQSVTAAIVRVSGDNSLSASVFFDPTDQPTSLILELFNEAVTPLSVSVWQLDLNFAGLVGSEGELQIQSVGPASNGLFGSVPGPIGIDVGGRYLIFDGDPLSEFGSALPPGTAKNIVELAITGSPDASGSFELRMNNLDPSNPASGSSLLAAGEFVPKVFSNPPSAVLNQSVIATIVIGAVIPEPSSFILTASFVVVLIGRWARTARTTSQPPSLHVE